MLAAVGWLWAWRTLRRLPTTPGEPGAEPPPYPPPGDPGVGGTATVDRFRRRDDRGQDGQQGKRPGRSTPAMFPRTPPADSRTGPPPSTGRRRRRRLASLFRVRSPSPQRYPAPQLHLGGGAGGLLPHIGHDRAVASTQVLSSASGPISGGSRPRIRRWLRSDGGVARWRPPPRRPPKQQRQVAGQASASEGNAWESGIPIRSSTDNTWRSSPSGLTCSSDWANLTQKSVEIIPSGKDSPNARPGSWLQARRSADACGALGGNAPLGVGVRSPLGVGVRSPLVTHAAPC